MSDGVGINLARIPQHAAPWGKSALPPELQNAAQFRHHEIAEKNLKADDKFVHESERMTVVKVTAEWVWATFDKWSKQRIQS